MKKTDDLRKHAIASVIWYGGSRFGIQAVSWVVTIVVARLLSPSEYGLLGFSMIVMGFGELLSELSLGVSLIQMPNIQSRDLDTAFWAALFVNGLIYGVMFIVAPYVAIFFNQTEVTSVLRVIALMFLIGAIRVVPWSLLTRDVNFKKTSIIEVVARITGAITTLLLAYEGCGVWALVVGILLQSFLCTLLVYCFHPWKPHLRFSLISLRSMLPFGAKVSFARFGWFIYTNADSFVVGKLLGQNALGHYSFVLQLGMAFANRFVSVISNVAFPVYSKLQGDSERTKRYFLKTVGLTSIVGLPVLCGMYLVADLAIPCFLTLKWIAIVIPLKIMCWTGGVMSFGALIASVLYGNNRADLNAKFSGVCCVVLPVGFIVGAHYGLEGVCWAWAVLYSILVGGYYYLTRQLINYSWMELYVSIKPAIICTIVMSIAVCCCESLFKPIVSPTALMWMMILVGGVSYLIVTHLAFASTMNEIKSLFKRSAM